MAWFDLYMRELDAHVARQELMISNGVALGTANAYNGKDQGVKSAVRDQIRRAYPGAWL